MIANRLEYLTPVLMDKLQQIASENDLIALHIDNLPKFNHQNSKHLNIAKYIYLGLSALIGEPFQYYGQKDKSLVSEVEPKIHLINTQSNGGTIAFDWHTNEDCFPRHRAKWRLLGGLRNPDKVLAKIAPIDPIIESLSEKDIKILMSKRYVIGLPKRFVLEKSYFTSPLPALRINSDGRYEIAIRTNNIKTADPYDHEAINAIKNLILNAEKVMTGFCLDNGNCVIFNNNCCLHSQDSIKKSSVIKNLPKR